MAATIPELRAKVIARLKLSGAASEPSNAQLDEFVLSAVKQALAELHPIFELEALVTAQLTALVPDALQLIAVQSERDILVEHEWTRMSTGVRLRSYRVAKPGETVLVWYTKRFVLSLVASVDTSCALGVDWLEDYMLELSTKLALGHMINISGSMSGELHGQQYRVTQDQIEALHRRLQLERGRLELMIREAKADRVFFSPPLRRSALRGFVNRSRHVNRAAD